MLRNIFPLLLLILLGPSLTAQEVRENARGEKMIVYPDGSWRYFNERTIRPAGTFPVVNDTIDRLKNPTKLNEEIVRKVIDRKSQVAKEAMLIAQERANRAIEQRRRIESELANTRQSGADQHELERINTRLKAAQSTEMNARKEAMLAKKELADMQNLAEKGNLLEEFVQKQKDRANRIEDRSEDYSASTLSPETLIPDELRYPDLSSRYNTLINPPAPDCRLAFTGQHPKTGRFHRDMPKRRFFTFTDPKLRRFLKDKEYLECNGFLSTVDGGYRLLTLEFNFAYPNAREAYGFIEKGSMLSILFLNGDFVNLKSGVVANGQYDMQTKLLTYRVQYPISGAQIAYLKKNEVDKVRVNWSSGFEEYPVYEVDFFIDQMECLGW